MQLQIMLACFRPLRTVVSWQAMFINNNILITDKICIRIHNVKYNAKFGNLPLIKIGEPDVVMLHCTMCPQAKYMHLSISGWT